MLKVGAQNIASLYVGGTKIKQAYVGEEMVYGPPKTYTVTATIDPSGAGTVTGAGQYQEGESVTVTATPAEGYTFSGWTENGATVSTSESYTFTVTGSRALVAGFAEIQTPGLPEGYTEVEYISGNGGYVNLGISPTLNTEIIVDVNVGTGYPTLFGCFYRSGSSSSTYRFTELCCKYYYYPTTSVMLYHMYNSRTNTPNDPKIQIGEIPGRRTICVSLKDKLFSVNDNSVSIQITSFSIDVPMYLFAENRKLGSSTSAPSTSDFYLYSCKIKENGNLVMDLVPCTNPSGEVGLYDLVSGNFYGNAGTGDFVAGPAV